MGVAKPCRRCPCATTFWQSPARRRARGRSKRWLTGAPWWRSELYYSPIEAFWKCWPTSYVRILASAVELFAFEARAQSDGVWKACELGRKEPDQSIRACSEVLTGATTLRPAALYNRGIAYTAKGDLDRALVDLSEAIRLDPQRAFRFQERGELHLRRREFDRAIADLTRAIQMDPIRAFRFHFRAHAYREAGDLDRAILDFTEAIRLDSTHSFRFYDRASAFRDKGEWVKAIADYDVAIRLDPKSAGSYAERGWLHLRLGRVEQAVVDLSEAVRLDPNYAEAHARLGEASRTSGDLHAAERPAQQRAELKREREQDAARTTRLVTLDRLKVVQKEAEDRTPKDAPSSFRRRLEALRAEFASCRSCGFGWTEFRLREGDNSLVTDHLRQSRPAPSGS